MGVFREGRKWLSILTKKTYRITFKRIPPFNSLIFPAYFLNQLEESTLVLPQFLTKYQTMDLTHKNRVHPQTGSHRLVS